MKAARQIGTLVMIFIMFLALAATTFAQEHHDGNLAERQKAPTVLGGTGLFNTFSTRTLCKGEFNFALFWNNFDRDPGDIAVFALDQPGVAAAGATPHIAADLHLSNAAVSFDHGATDARTAQQAPANRHVAQGAAGDDPAGEEARPAKHVFADLDGTDSSSGNDLTSFLTTTSQDRAAQGPDHRRRDARRPP